MWSVLGELGLETAKAVVKTVAVTGAIVGTIALADRMFAKPARKSAPRRRRRAQRA